MPGEHRDRGLYSLARSGFIEYEGILFFSTAVMAIAVTLLAVDLWPPFLWLSWRRLRPSTSGPDLDHGHRHQPPRPAALGL